jgi:hypothetical protein
MRRGLILLGFSLMLMGGAIAQDEQVTKTYGPKAGQFAVGIEASPVLDFIGNMFAKTNKNESRKWWKDNQDYTLHGRYFLTDNSAVRLHIRFNNAIYKDVEKKFTVDDAAKTKNPLSTAKVEDKKVVWNNDWRVAAGYQQFRGAGRLKGFYGGDVFYRYQRTFTNNYYGNKMNAFNPAPSNALGETAGDRTLKSVGSGQHSLGLMGFTGVEFYFMQNACIGFELGLVLQGTYSTRGYVTKERVFADKVEQYTEESALSNNSFHFGTNPNTDPIPTGLYEKLAYGNFYLMFHF